MLRPGVPAARAAALEAAFARTFADLNFQAEAEKSQLEISPLYGESIRQIVGDFLTMPPAIKERLKRSLKR
jgi:tripartite-type tricarboxylate transporter receptor subunit TctC